MENKETSRNGETSFNTRNGETDFKARIRSIPQGQDPGGVFARIRSILQGQDPGEVFKARITSTLQGQDQMPSVHEQEQGANPPYPGETQVSMDGNGNQSIQIPNSNYAYDFANAPIRLNQ